MLLKRLAHRKPLSQDVRGYLNTVTVALSLALAYSLFTHILIPATHSVYPKILYRSGEVAKEQDQYVLFFRKDNYLPRGEGHLVKRLGCMPGQYLSRLGNQFFCNGKEIAQAMQRDQRGQTLPDFRYTGLIPEGKAFAVGDTANSYDSRYWGFIDIKLTERLIPLI